MWAENQRPGRHLAVHDTAQTIAFYTDVFDAVQLDRECLLDGHVLHAELAVGSHRLTVSEWYDAAPPADAGSPGAGAGALTIERADAEAVLRRALAAGAHVEPQPEAAHQIILRDPAGLCWNIVAPRPEAS
ncbi:VOC family protein [Micromonospora sp. NPDC047074]|uniref:VOC family protein n=1 Tax=Micromonospora sp. NPDC047074 TaxID=3154339 RepID=UPI0033EC269B